MAINPRPVDLAVTYENKARRLSFLSSGVTVTLSFSNEGSEPGGNSNQGVQDRLEIVRVTQRVIPPDHPDQAREISIKLKLAPQVGIVLADSADLEAWYAFQCATQLRFSAYISSLEESDDLIAAAFDQAGAASRERAIFEATMRPLRSFRASVAGAPTVSLWFDQLGAGQQPLHIQNNPTPSASLPFALIRKDTAVICVGSPCNLSLSSE